MGWTAEAVKRASLWEFFSAWDGYVQANTPTQKGKLTPEEKAELIADIEAYGFSRGGVLSTQTYLLDGLHLVPAGIVTFEVH